MKLRSRIELSSEISWLIYHISYYGQAKSSLSMGNGDIDPDPSPLQTEIIEFFSANPDATGGEAAEKIGSSSSYANQVRRNFREEIRKIGISKLNVGVGLAYPFKVICSPETLSLVGVESGELVKAQFETETDRDSFVAPMHSREGAPWNDGEDGFRKEIHGSFYGIYRSFESVQGEFDGWYANVDSEYGDKPDLSTHNNFANFWNTVADHTRDRFSDVDIVIGISLLEILTDERIVREIIATPLYKIEKGDLINYLKGELPDLLQISPFDGQIDEPTSVYFAHYGEELTQEIRDRARREIISMEVFHAGWNYIIPGFNTLVGPTAINNTSNTIRVSEDNLEIVPGVSQEIIAETGEFDYEAIRDRIQDTELRKLGEYSENRTELPTRSIEESQQIVFLLGDLSISLRVEEDKLIWQYPDGIELYEQFVMAINSDIGEHFGFNLIRGDREVPQGTNLPEHDKWTLDTNAIYHQIVDDEPSSILYTLLQYDEFYQNEFHVPWILLFEVNKEPARTSAPSGAIDQAKENLLTLFSLDNLGVFDLEIQEFPEDIQVDIGQSDIADILFASYVQTHETALITGDKNLQDILLISEIPTINIHDYANIESDIARQADLEEEVLNEIGFTLNTHDEIYDEIESQLEALKAQGVEPSVEVEESEIESHISRWVDRKDIIAFLSNGEISYKQTEPVEFVLSPSAIEPIVQYIDETGEGEYIPEICLEEARRTANLSTSQYPTILFQVPVSVITGSDTEGQELSETQLRLYRLKQTKNSEYTIASPEGGSMVTQYPNEPITIAIQKDIPLLVGSEDQYMERLAGLFGVGVCVIEEPD